ncbi:MAG: hypothetical protein ACOC7R_00700 [Planctomycetota bacterium]
MNRSMHVATLATLVTALGAVGPGGCNSHGQRIDTGGSGSERRVAPELLPGSKGPLPDVPVPQRFELDTKRSRAVATSGIRVVDHHYVGSADKWAVGRFYKRYMPDHDWTTMSDQMLGGDVFLQFQRGRERCTIKITDHGWRGTDISVLIVPEVPARTSGNY